MRSAHGEPRSTHALDVVIDPTPAQLDQVLAALPMDDYYVDHEVAPDALRRRSMFNVIEIATAWKLNLMIRKARAFSIEELQRRQTDADPRNRGRDRKPGGRPPIVSSRTPPGSCACATLPSMSRTSNAGSPSSISSTSGTEPARRSSVVTIGASQRRFVRRSRLRRVDWRIGSEVLPQNTELQLDRVERLCPHALVVSVHGERQPVSLVQSEHLERA